MKIWEKELSNDEILTYIEKRIPRDAEEIERYTDNQNGHREIIEYKSEQLKEIIIDEEGYINANLSIGQNRALKKTS